MSSEQSPPCGYSIFCRESGTVSVLSDMGGYFGHVCDEHADELNMRMERIMDYRRGVLAGIATDQASAMPQPSRSQSGAAELIHKTGSRALDGRRLSVCRTTLDPALTSSTPPLAVESTDRIAGLVDVLEQEFGGRARACPVCWRAEWKTLEERVRTGRSA